MGTLVVAGISHRTAALDVRDRLVFTPAELAPAVERIRAASGAVEGVMLSTCNRTEVYLVEGERDAVPEVWAALGARLGADAAAHGYVYRDREAVAHLMRVAAGLDSMVLGESQVHGQVRDAWEQCRAQSGAALHRLFQAALATSGRIRSDTAVGRGAASVSSAAVQLARQIFGTLRGRRVMIVGAGEMAGLALECLASEGVIVHAVASRTLESAKELGQRHGAQCMRLDDCWPELANVDLVLTSTASPTPILAVEQVRTAIARRGDRPLCILDIAVPRDVAPAVGALANVFLYDLDGLHRVIESNLDRRRAELPAAERIVAGEVERYWQWLAGLAAVPVLTSFRSAMDELRAAETDAALRRLGALTDDQRETVEQLGRALMNKFMHEPSVRLRKAAANGRGLGAIDAMRYLFGLEAAPPAEVAAGSLQGEDGGTT